MTKTISSNSWKVPFRGHDTSLGLPRYRGVVTALILLFAFTLHAETVTITSAFSAGGLKTQVDKNISGNYAGVEKLIITAGTLNSTDCKFITASLTGLKELYVEGSANFANGEIPKSAFEGNLSLTKVKADNATAIAMKAFSLCENIEEINFPNVKALGVQAFAQAKGSSTSKMKTALFPKLQSMEQRVFYYCINLEKLYLTTPPTLTRPEGKEGLWFDHVTGMVIHVPSRAAYDEFVKPENCLEIDWSAFDFVADNGDKLPEIQQAAAYNDADYNYLRNELLPNFDKSDKDFSGGYYNGDYKLSLNMYTFNMNVNAWINNTSSAPQLSTFDAIRWAKKAGFDAVDITCYYIPGYSNTTMPTASDKEILEFARQIKALCAEIGIEISGTGIQNNFADPNNARRELDIERAKFWIKVANEMGAPVIRIFAGPPPVDIRREGWEKIARDRMAADVRTLALYAKKNYPNVRIGIQNHGDMLATANQVIQFLKWVDCDNVGVVNDTGYYREFLNNDATTYDWYTDIALILPYSNNFQVKKKPAGAETTELMDLNRLFTDMRQSPYRGYVPVELLWISKDAGYPGDLTTPPYEETTAFLAKVKKAMQDTKNENTNITLRLKTSHPNIIEVNETQKTISVVEKTGFYQLLGQIILGNSTLTRITDSKGTPRTDIEELQDGDRFNITKGSQTQTYVIDVKRYELINLALDPNAANIKVSTYRGSTSGASAFDGNSTGTSGSGWQVDGSQATTAGKETFWLAVDLGEEKTISSFGVAWGTSVGNLKNRLKDGTYRVEYTSDPAKWSALSNATENGKNGLSNYSKPSGWTVAYSQDVNELPDANGNKVFISPDADPIRARYVMVTGETATSWVEIYNFFVFQKVLTDGKTEVPAYGTHDLARIKPDYTGMSLMIGRPAIIKQGTQTPTFHVQAMENIQLSGKMIDPNGKTVYTLSPVNIKKDATYQVKPGTAATANGTYTMEFTIAGTKTVYDKYYFTSVNEDITKYTYDNPYPAIYLSGGKLIYVPDYKGNTVIDYSNAGYKGGGIAIPNVPVKIILEPAVDSDSDDTERIQNAINTLGRIEPDNNGFRGAILLKAGTYRVSSSIRIDKSGIVIKGEDDGHEKIKKHDNPLSPSNWYDYTQSEEAEAGITKVIATWTAASYDKNVAIFNFAGGGTVNTGTSINVADQYAPAGSHKIRLENVSGLNAGDNVRIKKAVNASWTQDLKMDAITDAPGVLSANQWAKDGVVGSAYTDLNQERTIKSVDAATNTITLNEPLTDALDMKYGISTVTKFEATGRIQNAGIENIQLISRFDPSSTANNSAFGVDYKSYDDEYHAQVGIRIGNAENIWVRRITTYHIDGAANVYGGVRWVTIQDVNCLEPVSGTGGERRYSFSNSGGTLVLNQRNYTRYTRHGFIVMGNVVGPNVFYNDRSDYQFDANEPHLRWSTGGLFDNVKGRIYVQNRWNNGTAHGWSGANYTLYNNEGKYIISQNQLAANYLFGQSNAGDRLPFVMDEVDPGNVPNFRAYEYSNGTKMPPGSLFIQQLSDRAGQQAVNNVNISNIPAYIDESGNFAGMFAYLSGITVDGVAFKDFKKDVLTYTVPVPLDYTKLPVITATGADGATVQKSDNNKAVTFTVTKAGKVQSVYTVNYGIISKSPISSSGSTGQLNNLLDGNAATMWSSSGSPWVQFYLGDSPAQIEQVSLGYGRDTQIRRQYYFDFEVSDDGYNWTKVTSSSWQQDNLGRGHLMGMVVMPGVGNDQADYETFIFPAGIQARLLRISMYGARNGQSTGSTNSNKYWAIDVVASGSAEALTITKQPKSVSKKKNTTATFEVVTTGGAIPVSYQWQVSNNNGTTWNNVEGTTNSFYVTVTPEVDNNRYRCVITDNAGVSLTSNAVTLTMKEDSGITVTPTGTEVVIFDDIIYSKDAQLRNTSFVSGLLSYIKVEPANSVVAVVPSNKANIADTAEAYTTAIADAGREIGDQIRETDNILIISPSNTVERLTISYTKMTDSQKVNADKTLITFDAIKGDNLTANQITGNLTLPAAIYGSTITWTTSNALNLTTGGVVKRPSFGAADLPVTFTATITSGSVSETVSFELAIKAKDVNTPPGKDTSISVSPVSEILGLSVTGTVISGVPTATSAETLKNSLNKHADASFKVFTKSDAAKVTDFNTFVSTAETTKNISTGNNNDILTVFAEDETTFAKYTIRTKPVAGTPNLNAVPGATFGTTKLTGMLQNTAYQYIINDKANKPSASLTASAINIATGVNQTDYDFTINKDYYIHIRTQETSTLSPSEWLNLQIPESAINTTIDENAPKAVLTPGSLNGTTKMTGLQASVNYEYIIDNSPVAPANWDGAVSFKTGSTQTTYDNISVVASKYIHLRAPGLNATAVQNIYVTTGNIRSKTVPAAPKSVAVPGTHGGTVKLTNLESSTTYIYIINTNETSSGDAWSHKGQAFATGNGETTYDNIIASPELYMHLVKAETAEYAMSAAQNYLLAGMVNELPAGITPTATAQPGTNGGTMKLTALLPNTSYQYVINSQNASPKNTTWGEEVVIKFTTGNGETTHDNVQVPAELGYMHLRTAGTETRSPSASQNFEIKQEHINNSSAGISSDATVKTVASGLQGYINSVFVSGKAPNFTINGVPAGTGLETLKNALTKHVSAQWKIVASKTIANLITNKQEFDNAKEITTTFVENDNYLVVIAEDGITINRYQIIAQ